MYELRNYDLKNKFEYLLTLGGKMYNLISFNNLKDIVVNQNNFDETNELDKVSEYFECITECDVNDSSCRSYCRQVLD